MMLTLGQIAEMVGGELQGDAQCPIAGAGPIDQAVEHQITFAEKGAGLKHVAMSCAAAYLVPRNFLLENKNLVRVKNPRLAFAQVVKHFHSPARPSAGVHPSAVTGDDLTMGKNVSIGPGVVIGDHVTLGDGVILFPNVVLGDHVIIGRDTRIYPQVSILERCRIGERVIIHAGTVIGSDGFGFVFDNGHYYKMPQVGIVQIEDDVEIGACNTIDRATFGKTWIKAGVKTDNQVHIAHNVTVGEHTAIAAQVGIAGSSSIGHHVAIGGQAGFAGHLTVGNEVMVGGKAGVVKSVADRQVISGTMTAMPHSTWLRVNRLLPGLPEMHKQIHSLEERLARLEKLSSNEKG